MMGVFVRTNEGSRTQGAIEVGYLIREDGCWEWVGSVDKKGYGRAWNGHNTELAHRVIYERERGPIPEGMECHHTCAYPTCVNPDHLEILTSEGHHTTDPQKGTGIKRTADRNRAKTHCPHGHPYVGDNLYVSRGRRFCRTCKRGSQNNVTIVI